MGLRKRGEKRSRSRQANRVWNLNGYIGTRDLTDRKRHGSTAIVGRGAMKRSILFYAMAATTLVGLLVSAYLTFLSLSPPSSCPVGDFAVFSCDEVLWSEYSHFYGVSVALLGLGWFVIAAGLLVLAWRDGRFIRIVVAWALLGAVGVVGFVYTEIFLLGSICPLCTIAHLSGLAMLAISVLALRRPLGTE
jgi:uncharacterized membrane protein